MNTYSEIMDMLVEDHFDLVNEFVDMFNVTDENVMSEISPDDMKLVTKWLSDLGVDVSLFESKEDIASAVSEIYGSLEAGQEAFKKDMKDVYENVYAIVGGDKEDVYSKIDEMFNISENKADQIPEEILANAKKIYDDTGAVQHINYENGRYSISDWYDYETTVKSFGIDLYENKEDIASAVSEIYGSLEAGQKAFNDDKQDFYKEVISYVKGDKDEMFPIIDEMFNTASNLSESDMNEYYDSIDSSTDKENQDALLALLEDCNNRITPRILSDKFDSRPNDIFFVVDTILSTASSRVHDGVLIDLFKNGLENAREFLIVSASLAFAKMEKCELSSNDVVNEVFRSHGVCKQYGIDFEGLYNEYGSKTYADAHVMNLIADKYSVQAMSNSGVTSLVDIYTDEAVAVFDFNKNVATFYNPDIMSSIGLCDLSVNTHIDPTFSVVGVQEDVYDKLMDIYHNTDNNVLRIYLEGRPKEEIVMDIVGNLEPEINDILASYPEGEYETIGGIKMVMTESISDGYRSITMKPYGKYEEDKVKAVNPQMFKDVASEQIGGVSVSESTFDISKKSCVTVQDVIAEIGVQEGDALEIVKVLNDQYSVSDDQPQELKDKKEILSDLFESKSIRGVEKIWKLHESVDAPIQTYADMIVRNSSGEVLIMQRNSDCDFEPNKWGFAGGKVQVGETTEQGAIRECLEEAGIQCSEVSKIGEFVNADGSVSHYYTCISDAEVIMSDESQNFAWVSAESIPDFDLILGNTNNRFEKVLGIPVVMNESKVYSILSDLAKGDIVEIMGLISSPKRYAKTSVSRVVLDKLNDKGIVGDRATRVVDKVMKFYPATRGVFSFIDGLLESDDRVAELQDRISVLEADATASEEEKKALRMELQEIKLSKYEEEIKKLNIRLEAIEKEEKEETDVEKKDKLKEEKEAIVEKQATLSGKIEEAKKAISDFQSTINDAGGELDEFLDDPFSKIS